MLFLRDCPVTVDAMARLSQFVIDNEQDLKPSYPQKGGITSSFATTVSIYSLDFNDLNAFFPLFVQV
ncbi:hypothetical protein HA51_23335 [Pantoea rwandensis]|uniref:Uncharacterized protein n=1 Tax=Pantoea rwandensis TaxID=1076550 RepID=A0A1X1CQF3_9GAMM|nr:hypothetical protein HA51_23335 [Pantoea rwandensis]